MSIKVQTVDMFSTLIALNRWKQQVTTTMVSVGDDRPSVKDPQRVLNDMTRMQGQIAQAILDSTFDIKA